MQLPFLIPALPAVTDCHPARARGPARPSVFPSAAETSTDQTRPAAWPSGAEGERQGEARCTLRQGTGPASQAPPHRTIGEAKKVPDSHPQPWARDGAILS